MRKLKLTIMAAVFMLVAACEPLEIEVQEAFDFEIQTEYISTNFIDMPINTHLSIVPEREQTEVKYFLSYKITSGSGYFKMEDSILTPNQEYEIEDLEMYLNYFGNTAELNEVKLTIRDNNDQEKEQLLTFNIIDRTDFIFDASITSNEVYLTQEKQLFFEVATLDNELDEDIEYSLTWAGTSVPGDLIINDEPVNLFQEINITPGDFSGFFTAADFGNVELVFTVEASNGMMHSKTIEFDVLQTVFEATIIPEESSDYVKDFTTFYVDIDKQGIEDLSYSIVFSGQQGEFLYNDEYYSTGEQISGITEENFELEYRANEITNSALEIVITASNGVSRTIDVDYDSLATDFEVVITPNPMSRLYVFPQTFYMSIIPPAVDDYELEYTMYYESTVGAVALDFHDIDISGPTGAGIVFDLGSNTYSSGNVTQLGSISPREGDLIFHFTDSNGVTKSKTIEVEWYDHEFED